MWWEELPHLSIKQNQLHFAGRSLVELAKTYGTPTYFYDKERIANRCEELLGAIKSSKLKNVNIKYAIKANNNQQVINVLADHCDGIDATSPNELKLAKECGFNDEEIVFTGTALSQDDLSILEKSDVLVNFDSVSSLQRFEGEKDREVGLRINSGVGLGRSKKTTTGGTEAGEKKNGVSAGSKDGVADSTDSIPVKFGIPYDDNNTLEEAFNIIEKKQYDLTCIHHHVGSGWLTDQALGQEPNYFTALRNTLEVAEKAYKRGHDISILDLGGGYGVPHKEGEESLDLIQFFNTVSEYLAETSVSIDSVFIEPGTYLTSDAGVFVTKVNTVERKNGYQFIGVNSGLNSFNSFAHYDYYHEVINCNKVITDGDGESVIIAGNNCESGDLFTDERFLRTTISEGDYIALLNAGAYGAVFRNEFNLREPADEIII
jgi:diaminopimelate decarboxylase